MSDAITVDQANIATTTVTIRAIQVGNKQMTLAVFRQLPENEPVRDSCAKSLEPAGSIWGWVNVHDKNCVEEGKHRHVILQDGDHLTRAIIRIPDFYNRPSYRQRGALCNLLTLQRIVDGDISVELINEWRRRDRYNAEWKLNERSISFDLMTHLGFYSYDNDSWGQRRLQGDALEKLNELLKNSGQSQRTQSDIYADITAIDQEIERTNIKWQLLWDEIESAGQLFVAV